MPRFNRMQQENEKFSFTDLKKVIIYCKVYLPFIILTLVFATLGSIATIIGPEKINDLISIITKGVELKESIDLKEVFNTSLFLVFVYALGALFTYIGQFITATITQHISQRLRNDLDKKINKIPLNYFDTTTKGDILSIVTNDVDIISQNLSSSAANIISALTLFFGVSYKMFATNFILSITAILTSFLGLFLMGIILKKSQKYFNRKQKDLGEMNGQIEEVYSNLKIVNIFGGKTYESKKFEDINAKLYEDNWKSQIMSGMMMHIMTFIGNLSYVLIFVIGVYFILQGNDAVKLGTIMQFVIYSKLFSQSLTTSAQSLTAVQQLSAASKRVFSIIEQEELSDESYKSTKLNSVKGDVIFENVNFGYTSDKTIINNFSAQLKSGQKVAIVGPTGAGKTTIVNLLMRFYEITSGDIRIDNISISDMKREEVHDLFNMILQDTWLFEGTIRENLVYNKENVSDETLDKVCKAVGLEHFIKSLKYGYDTFINDKLNLSEGQKQQITIARAMIKDAPLLILDEATSSIDTRTELIIQEAMDRLTINRTSFVIAHRLSTIKNADLILVMNNGDIVESGTHETLLERHGFYAELYNSQFASN